MKDGSKAEITPELRDFFADATVVQDPVSYFNQLRSQCPVLREQHHDAIMLTGYDAVLDVLSRRDGSFSSSVSVAGPIPPLPFTPQGDDISALLEAHREELPWSAHLVSFDGEKHSAHRALVTALLTHERLKRTEDYLTSLADRLIDKFLPRGECEVVADFAHATATYAICDLLGIPEADRAELLALLGPAPTSIEGDPAHKIGPDPLVFLEARFTAYIEKRRTNPVGDLMSELAASRYKDGTLPEVKMLAGLARFIFGAGQDTSARTIAAAVRLLGDDPQLQRRLRAERHRIADFVEEVLRFDAPTKCVFRLATKSTTVERVEVSAGSVITVGLLAANHDPGHFENPALFDIDRPRLRDHLTFSRGAHACPGAPLARLETRIAIDRLLDRLADIRIAEKHHGPAENRSYRYEPTYMLRSLSELHIEFTPA